MYARGIRRLLPHLRVPPLAAVLDVGCGTGVNMVEAARWFGPLRLLCGIDISPGMAEVARTKMRALGIPAQIAVGDAEQLPYPDGIFDLVICNSVLHWVRNRQTALQEMRRVLRPGGQLALICASRPGFGEWFGLIDTVLRMVAGPNAPVSRPDLPTALEVAALLQSAGFAIEHLANPVSVQHVTDAEGFVRLMSTVAPNWSADLPPQVQAAAEQLTVGLIRAGWPAGFPCTWSATEAIATRMR